MCRAREAERESPWVAPMVVLRDGLLSPWCPSSVAGCPVVFPWWFVEKRNEKSREEELNIRQDGGERETDTRNKEIELCK